LKKKNGKCEFGLDASWR